MGVQAPFEAERHSALLAREEPVFAVVGRVDLSVPLEPVGLFERRAAVLALVLHPRLVLGFPPALLPFPAARGGGGCVVGEVKVNLLDEGPNDLDLEDKNYNVSVTTLPSEVHSMKKIYFTKKESRARENLCGLVENFQILQAFPLDSFGA